MALPELLEQETPAFDITRVRHRRYPVRVRIPKTRVVVYRIHYYFEHQDVTTTYRYVPVRTKFVLVNLERETSTPATSTCDVHAGS